MFYTENKKSSGDRRGFIAFPNFLSGTCRNLFSSSFCCRLLQLSCGCFFCKVLPAAAFSAASAAFFSASAFAFTSLIFFSASRRALASAFLASSCLAFKVARPDCLLFFQASNLASACFSECAFLLHRPEDVSSCKHLHEKGCYVQCRLVVQSFSTHANAASKFKSAPSRIGVRL